MALFNPIFLVSFALLSGQVALAATNPSAYAIPKDRICAAIGLGGSDCDNKVDLLVNPVARQDQPRLHWQIEYREPAAIVVRIDCAEFACVPFLVLVRGHHHKMNAKIDVSRHVAPASKNQPIIHPGARLTLIRQGKGVRLITSAVSLSPGNVGDSIRVREQGSSRPTNSVVLDAHTVTADY